MPQPNKHLPKKPFFNTLSAYYQCISNIPRCSSLYLDIIATKGQKIFVGQRNTYFPYPSVFPAKNWPGSKGSGRVGIG